LTFGYAIYPLYLNRRRLRMSRRLEREPLCASTTVIRIVSFAEPEAFVAVAVMVATPSAMPVTSPDSSSTVAMSTALLSQTIVGVGVPLDVSVSCSVSPTATVAVAPWLMEMLGATGVGAEPAQTPLPQIASFHTPVVHGPKDI
jgi:hypothetical protein